MSLEKPEVSPWVLWFYSKQLMCEYKTSVSSCPLEHLTFNLGNLLGNTYFVQDTVLDVNRDTKKRHGPNCEAEEKANNRIKP